MGKRIAAILLGAALLLGLAGCTPATGNGEDTASPDTAASAIDQAAVEESAETTTETNSETVPEEGDTTSDASSYVPTPPPAPTPIQPETPPADEPAGEEPGPGDGQGGQNQEPKGYYWPENAYYFDYWDPDFRPKEAIPPKSDNTGVPDDFITVQYNACDLAISAFGECVHLVGTMPVTIGEVQHAYPIECLRQVDENTLYAVYKTEQGGYFYVHFQKMLREPHWAGQYEDGSYYKGEFVITSFSYVTEKHALADYEQLEIGDSIDEAAAIDSALELWKFLYASSTEGFSICQYLTDGMLEMKFVPDGQGGLVLDSKNFYSESIWDLAKEYNNPDGLVINTSILEQDFPS